MCRGHQLKARSTRATRQNRTRQKIIRMQLWVPDWEHARRSEEGRLSQGWGGIVGNYWYSIFFLIWLTRVAISYDSTSGWPGVVKAAFLKEVGPSFAWASFSEEDRNKLGGGRMEAGSWAKGLGRVGEDRQSCFQNGAWGWRGQILLLCYMLLIKYFLIVKVICAHCRKKYWKLCSMK